MDARVAWLGVDQLFLSKHNIIFSTKMFILSTFNKSLNMFQFCLFDSEFDWNLLPKHLRSSHYDHADKDKDLMRNPGLHHMVRKGATRLFEQHFIGSSGQLNGYLFLPLFLLCRSTSYWIKWSTEWVFVCSSFSAVSINILLDQVVN